MSRPDMIRAGILFAVLALLALLAACKQSAQEHARAIPDAADVATADAQAAQAAQADSSATALPLKKASVTDMPMPGATAAPTATVGATGFGTARFGMHRVDVEHVANGAFEGSTQVSGCQRTHRAGQPDIVYLFDDGKLQRIDVRTPGVMADGGGHVGMQIDEIRTLYAGKLTEQPRNDVHGGLSLKAIDKNGSGLIFETDANGIVTAFRAGVAPELDRVEGCS